MKLPISAMSSLLQVLLNLSRLILIVFFNYSSLPHLYWILSCIYRHGDSNYSLCEEALSLILAEMAVSHWLRYFKTIRSRKSYLMFFSLSKGFSLLSKSCSIAHFNDGHHYFFRWVSNPNAYFVGVSISAPGKWLNSIDWSQSNPSFEKCS